MRILPLLLSFLFLTSCAQASPESGARELTADAQQILRKTGRSEYNPGALDLLNRAIEEDPDYLPARQERLNLYLVDQRIDAALEEAAAIVRIRDIPETRLFYCMIREAGSPELDSRGECYSDVAQAIEARTGAPHIDLNYVLALRLAGSPAFQGAAERHISQAEVPEVKLFLEELFFKKTRKELIRSFLPNS